MFALAVLGCAAVMSAWTTLQLVLDPAAPRGAQPLWRSLVGSTAPAASGTALSLALVLWASGVRPHSLRAELPRVLQRGALAALPGFLAASVVALAVAAAWLGAGGVSELGPRDFASGALSAALDSALVLALAWRFLPRLHGSGISLPGALSVVVAVTVPVRATAALVLSSLLSP